MIMVGGGGKDVEWNRTRIEGFWEQSAQGDIQTKELWSNKELEKLT